MFLLKHRKSIFIIQGYEVTRNLIGYLFFYACK
nr:MAG TPA: hypothetical protein [Caudoviricetes sp.]